MATKAPYLQSDLLATQVNHEAPLPECSTAEIADAPKIEDMFDVDIAKDMSPLLMSVGRQLITNTPGVELSPVVRDNLSMTAPPHRRRNTQDSGEVDPLRMYLDDVGSYKLLDKEGEQELGRSIRKAKLATACLALDGLRAALFGQPAMYPPEAKDISLIKEGQEAKDRFVHANFRLVVSFAKRYQGSGMELLDLIQEGSIGLAHAVDLFDERKGFRFSTYATNWIRQHISRAIAEQKRAIRLPSRANDIARTVTDDYMNNKKSIDEIAEEHKVGKLIVMGILSSALPGPSLDSPIGDDDSRQFGDMIGDPNSEIAFASTEDKIRNEALSKILRDVITSDRDLDIVKMRFGLDGYEEGMTLEEIGRKYGLTRERVRQIVARSLGELRKDPSCQMLLSE